MWHLTHNALVLRRTMEALGRGELRWRDDLVDDTDVLAFERVDSSGAAGLVCIANLSSNDVNVPAASLVLASQPDIHIEHGRLTLPQDTCAWFILA